MSSGRWQPIHGRTVLFGGWRSTALGDTWEYDTSGMASWMATEVGCAGSAGVPELRAMTRPVLGSTFSLQVTNASAGAIAFVGFSNASWNGASLPLSLAALGMPGCSVHLRPELEFAMTTTGSVARLDWLLPANASLAGIPFFTQALVVSPGANAFGAVVSNAGYGASGVF